MINFLWNIFDNFNGWWFLQQSNDVDECSHKMFINILGLFYKYLFGYTPPNHQHRTYSWQNWWGFQFLSIWFRPLSLSTTSNNGEKTLDNIVSIIIFLCWSLQQIKPRLSIWSNWQNNIKIQLSQKWKSRAITKLR